MGACLRPLKFRIAKIRCAIQKQGTRCSPTPVLACGAKRKRQRRLEGVGVARQLPGRYLLLVGVPLLAFEQQKLRAKGLA